ncbi:hypothetical protein CR513_01000, partial [Mucuna pruriens]
MGKLIYLSHTRLDIVSVTLSNSERIFLYLKENQVKGNVDYIGSTTDRRFTSNYCLFLGGNLVEFRAMAHSICEGLWMKIILDYLKDLIGKLGMTDIIGMLGMIDIHLAIERTVFFNLGGMGELFVKMMPRFDGKEAYWWLIQLDRYFRTTGVREELSWRAQNQRLKGKKRIQESYKDLEQPNNILVRKSKNKGNNEVLEIKNQSGTDVAKMGLFL